MIVCIGAFDGYHRGHFRLFGQADTLARSLGTDWRPVTFEPHPRFLLGQLSARLFSRAEKFFLRKNFAIPEPVEIPFTREFADIGPEAFLEGLRERFPVKGIVVGTDFCFGRNRSGDGSFLRGYCPRHGLELRLVPQLTDGGMPVSSSRVRSHVERGEPEAACALLGYPYFVCSRVIHGRQCGRTLGFPTANIGADGTKLLPREGVYACAAWHEGRWYPAAVSVGRNPTFLENVGVSVEAYLSGFSGDLYGRPLFLTFFAFLRQIERFPDRENLIAQMERDVRVCRDVFAARKDELSVFDMPRAFDAAFFC